MQGEVVMLYPIAPPARPDSQPSFEAVPTVLRTRAVRCGRTLWLQLHGVLNWRTTEAFWRDVRACLAQPCRRLVVDLSGVEYVGGDGLLTLTRLQEALDAWGIELRLVVPTGGRCARTISLARLHGVLPTFPHPARAWRHREHARRESGAPSYSRAPVPGSASGIRPAAEGRSGW
jgi:anti-anti-sigma factor